MSSALTDGFFTTEPSGSTRAAFLGAQKKPFYHSLPVNFHSYSNKGFRMRVSKSIINVDCNFKFVV